MKTLNWYVTKHFLVTFLMAIGILTFVMVGARLIKVFELISQGIPVSTMLYFIIYMLPTVLTYTIPWAVLVSVMLVFGRLSADAEITAMRACGISILQIISPILVLTFLLTCGCLYVQLFLGPPMLGKSRALMKNTAVNQPLALFEPGRPIKFGTTTIHIDDKGDNNTIKDVQIINMNKEGTEIEQDLTADSGKVSVDKKRQILTIELFKCLVIDRKSDPPTRIFSESVKFPFEYGKALNRRNLRKREKYLDLNELFGRIRVEMQANRDTTEYEVELNQRIAMALSSIAFLLLGLPLAVRTSRRETSIGLFLSVVLGGAFFLAIVICDSLTSMPGIYPQYILWIPNLLYQIVGGLLLIRLTRR
jgi:lipopolysaccharide export system permease protein